MARSRSHVPTINYTGIVQEGDMAEPIAAIGVERFIQVVGVKKFIKQVGVERLLEQMPADELKKLKERLK